MLNAVVIPAGVDEAVAPLLEDLRASRLPSLLVLTSDHGEALGDHGEETHGLFAYEATLHVPLILWGPGLVSPGRDESLRGHVDILPTVLAQVRAPLPSGLPGHSLLAASNPESGSYFEALSASITRGWAPLRGVIRDDGVGFDVPAVLTRRGGRGLGLTGIRERLHAVGGTLEIIATPRGGTRPPPGRPRWGSTPESG